MINEQGLGKPNIHWIEWIKLFCITEKHWQNLCVKIIKSAKLPAFQIKIVKNRIQIEFIQDEPGFQYANHLQYIH